MQTLNRINNRSRYLWCVYLLSVKLNILINICKKEIVIYIFDILQKYFSRSLRLSIQVFMNYIVLCAFNDQENRLRIPKKNRGCLP